MSTNHYRSVFASILLNVNFQITDFNKGMIEDMLLEFTLPILRTMALENRVSEEEFDCLSNEGFKWAVDDATNEEPLSTIENKWVRLSAELKIILDDISYELSNFLEQGNIGNSMEQFIRTHTGQDATKLDGEFFELELFLKDELQQSSAEIALLFRQAVVELEKKIKRVSEVSQESNEKEGGDPDFYRLYGVVKESRKSPSEGKILPFSPDRIKKC